MLPGLHVGKIVNYVLEDGPNEGDVRPAIIVRIWDFNAGTSQLQVFMDGDGGGHNDAAPNVVWKTSVTHSDDSHEGGTWHFIED